MKQGDDRHLQSPRTSPADHQLREVADQSQKGHQHASGTPAVDHPDHPEINPTRGVGFSRNSDGVAPNDEGAAPLCDNTISKSRAAGADGCFSRTVAILRRRGTSPDITYAEAIARTVSPPPSNYCSPAL